jgi:serine/threonine-protein kinase
MAEERPRLTSQSAFTTDSFTVERGTILAERYEVRHFIGRGGMGVVYKAHDRVLDEPVAIKILRPHRPDDGSMMQRFLAEIRLARRVTHKNVCRIHDFGQTGPIAFISMQFVDGIELKELIRTRGGLSLEEGFNIARQLADGLEAIHREGILHRDLKTSNVMVDHGGTALLMDFGLAKLWASDAGMTLTGTGEIIGTPEYMSPEQAQGERLDPRSDIYALGVILFELFAGVTPFKASSLAAVLHKKLHEPLQLDSPAAAKVPPALKTVIRKALAAAPADRYATVREFRDALLDARAQTLASEADTDNAIVPGVDEPRPASGVDAASRTVDIRSRRLAAGVAIAATALISVIVLSAVAFFQSRASTVDGSTVTTTIPGSSQSLQGAPSVTPIDRPSGGASDAPPVVEGKTEPCDSGDVAGCLALARSAEAAKDLARAADLYRKACDAGGGAACTAIGVLFNRGSDGLRDVAQAAVYYERGCTLGDMAGCTNLGTLYQFGSVGFRDPAKAAGLYERACTGGQIDGCANLGLLLLDTPGATSQERARARQLLTTACAGGVERACGRLR